MIAHFALQRHAQPVRLSMEACSYFISQRLESLLNDPEAMQRARSVIEKWGLHEQLSHDTVLRLRGYKAG